jgi:DNA-binding NarL/FixJ family response regulator
MPILNGVLPGTMKQVNCFKCGDTFSVPDISGKRVCDKCRAPKNISKRRIEVGGSLSHRQVQLLVKLVEAKSNKEIAYELGLSEGTIKEYLHCLTRKLQVSNRVALVVYAIGRGIVPLPSL